MYYRACHVGFSFYNVLFPYQIHDKYRFIYPKLSQYNREKLKATGTFKFQGNAHNMTGIYSYYQVTN